jgi:hypothetical protein
MAGGVPRPPAGVGCGPARIDLAANRPARCSPSPTRSTALKLQSEAGASVIDEAWIGDGDCFNVCLANPVADPIWSFWESAAESRSWVSTERQDDLDGRAL